MGRVKSTQYTNERIMRLVSDKDGYLMVLPYIDGRYEHWKVHRLVMQVFKGKSKLEVNHKDFDRKNNCLWNLEYLPHKENAARLERHGQAKSTIAQVQYIKRLCHRFSVTFISELLSLPWKYIWRIKRGETWAEV